MGNSKKPDVTRRTILKAGVAMPLLGIAAPAVLAQAPLKSPTRVLDFMTNADVAKAERVVATYEAALAAGRGSIGLDGMMLDVPVVERSQRVLDIAKRIAQRATRRKIP